MIVIAAIVSEDGECSTGENALTVCAREPRSVVNAFTSRCICDAVKSVAGLSDGLGNEERDENSLWAPPLKMNMYFCTHVNIVSKYCIMLEERQNDKNIMRYGPYRIHSIFLGYGYATIGYCC